MADVEIDLESSDAKELMNLGLRAYMIRDFPNAAAALGKATQLMAQEHGDEHDSLGEVYLHYARALLEVSREESEPLGDAIPNGESDSESSQEDEPAEGTTETGGEKKEDTADEKDEEKKEGAKVEEDGVVEKANGKESNTNGVEINGTSTATNGDVVLTSNGDVASTSNGIGAENTDNEKAEDCSDLQLAWEVLEVAKKIFTTRGDSGKELLATTLILLGEVAMESENFIDGISDIKAGADIQETLYEKTSRKLAETYYKLGISHTTMSSIEDAVKYFDLSISTLKQRIELLKEKDDDSSKKEIDEMETLIPEISEKINDTKSIKEETLKLIMEMQNTSKSQDEEAAGSSTKEVKDISHLVKRKRKVDDTPETNDDQPTKKPTP